MATIAVVGGGLAGLACAWTLARAGHAVRVLERGAEAGGRARSVRRGDFVLDTGTPVVTPGQRRVLALASEVGLPGWLEPWADGRDLRCVGRELLALPRRRTLGLFRAAARSRESLRAAFELQRGTRSGDAAEVTADAARHAALGDALCWWPDSPPELTADAPTLLSLRAGLPLAAPHSFPGGIGALARRLARRLDVATGCEVTAVETDSRGATLRLRTGEGETREGFDAAVLAVPATRVAPLCPKLGPEERGFFESARSEPGTIVHLLFERAEPLPFRSVRFERGAAPELRSLLVCPVRPGGAPEGAAVLRAALTPEAALRMHRAGDASVADLVLENLAYAPIGRLAPQDFAVWRHPDAVPVFGAGHCRRLARFAARLDRSPRLAFAGDALAGPSTDGAIAAGLRAAAEIARELEAR